MMSNSITDFIYQKEKIFNFYLLIATLPYKHGSFSSFPKGAQQCREINIDCHKTADLGTLTPLSILCQEWNKSETLFEDRGSPNSLESIRGNSLFSLHARLMN